MSWKAFCSVALALVAVPAFGLEVKSDFSAPGADGWSSYSGGDPTTALERHADGYLRLVEGATGGKDYFQASAAFTGNKSLWYGGTLSFDHYVSDATNATNWRDDVVLIGANGTRLIHTFGNNRPTVQWGERTLSLSVGDWFFDTASHSATANSTLWKWQTPAAAPRLATEAEIRGVLANISLLLIKGDHRAGAETNYLDNVVMTAPVPEPSTAIVGGLFIAGALWRLRRKA